MSLHGIVEESPELDIRFTYHKPGGNQPERYESIRANARAMAGLIVELTPESREQSLALTHLEEVVFWSNAAIARRENGVHPAAEGLTEEPIVVTELGAEEE